MQLREFLVVVVTLAALQLGSAQECGVVVMAEDELREEINKTVTTALEAEREYYKEMNKVVRALLEANKRKFKKEISKAVQQVVENITDTVQQLLDPLLTDLEQHHLPGTTSDHPATSCEEVKNSKPNSLSGYYWIQTATHPLVQQYCNYDQGFTQLNPASSCREIKEQYLNISSGDYWVENSEGQVIQVYCDMERTCGNVTGGWMRVADIDMRNSSQMCPSGLNELLESSKRLCSMNIYEGGCSSATITTHDVQYSHVCGKIIGYQQKTPDAFEYEHNSESLDDVYVDGISLTHGESPREHIWTFAAASHEVLTHSQDSLCPCTNIDNPIAINTPSFVGDDYFCETGSSNTSQLIFYPDDPLWDGEGCGPLSTCCSFNNPPWFSKQLPSPTTDDIEMRLCADQNRDDEDITFEQVELYVQ